MSALWTSAEIEAATGGVASAACEVIGVTFDSREVGPGDLFVAMPGTANDGHAFVAQAYASGAAGALVSQAVNGPHVLVGDVAAALEALAVEARRRTDATMIGVTGSVGKTSTKEALRAVFSAQGVTHASAASFNNHWGVPLSLARCPSSAYYAIFEIGMNHAGEIEPLVKMVRPHVAIVTTVEPVHLEFFSSVEAIADAKAEIFSGLEPGGAAVLNIDNPQFARLKQRAEKAGVSRIVSFGTHAKADARLIDISLHPTCSAVHADILGHDVTYKIAVPGKHIAMNSLAVLAAASLAGADLALSALALAQIKPASGRGVRETLVVASGTATLIDESYNANPASMAAALTVLGQAKVGSRGRRIAVLGDMLELGHSGPALHRGLTEAIAANKIDTVFCCGPLMQHLWDALPSAQKGGYADQSAALESQVVAALAAGDVIMIKGSLGSRMKLIVTSLQTRFPEKAALDDAAV